MAHSVKADVKQAPSADPDAVTRSALLLVLLVGLLVATPLQAQERLKLDLPSVLASVAGQTADQISTYRFLHNGSGCVEGNPALGVHPSTKRIVLQEVAATGGFIALEWWVTRLGNRSDAGPGGRRFAKWVSRALGYAHGAQGLKSAIVNVRRCGW